MELWRQIVETDPTVIGLAEGSRVFEVTVRPPQLAGLATGSSRHPGTGSRNRSM